VAAVGFVYYGVSRGVREDQAQFLADAVRQRALFSLTAGELAHTIGRSMIEWEPVGLGEPQVKSDPEYPANVIVYVPLTGSTDEVWATIFNSGPPAGVSYGIGLPIPRAEGNAVVFRCPPADVEKQFDLAKRWVEGTNAAFERDIMSELERRVQAAENEAEERRRAVGEARKRLGL
jgi:hypothetical protein